MCPIAIAFFFKLTGALKARCLISPKFGKLQLVAPAESAEECSNFGQIINRKSGPEPPPLGGISWLRVSDIYLALVEFHRATRSF